MPTSTLLSCLNNGFSTQVATAYVLVCVGFSSWTFSMLFLFRLRNILLLLRKFSKSYYWTTEDITKTYLYNFDPLKSHFYKVKLGFTGVYIIFLISAQKHRLWVLVRTASQKYEKYQIFLPENFQFLLVKFSIYLNRRVSIGDGLDLLSIKGIFRLVASSILNKTYKIRYPGNATITKNSPPEAPKTLRKHAYSNIMKISPPKTESFHIKILIYFIFLLKT